MSSVSVLRRASLEVLRAEAQDELRMLVLLRCRNGEDPWDFVSDLPSLDEVVVLSLFADALEEPAIASEGSTHILRQIALHHPALEYVVDQLIASGLRGGS